MVLLLLVYSAYHFVVLAWFLQPSSVFPTITQHLLKAPEPSVTYLTLAPFTVSLKWTVVHMKLIKNKVKII